MRAQTTLDFAIGMSIFLITVAAVVSFVPVMFQPFDTDGGGEMVSADRVADQLSRQLLTTGVEPFILDMSCTTGFFEIDESPPADCRFTGTSLPDRLGLADEANINIRLIGDTDGDSTANILCNDGSGTLIEADDGTCDTRFEAGSSPPTESNSVVVARRIVSIQSQDAALLVRRW